jgi:hypothetical protein
MKMAVCPASSSLSQMHSRATTRPFALGHVPVVDVRRSKRRTIIMMRADVLPSNVAVLFQTYQAVESG